MKNGFNSDYGSYVSGVLRIAGFLSLIVMLTPFHVVYAWTKPDEWSRFPLLFHRMLVKILGLRLRVRGTMSTAPAVLFVANHSSYLDIPVLGALIPAVFVAKTEVARWPLFGILARLQNTVFIERRAARMNDQLHALRERLLRHQSLILFPEGTSSDGIMVLPFKSSLFSVTENMPAENPLLVQPVSITCTELDGLPITRAWRPFYAWYGDMTLVGHLWNVFKIGRFTVDVVFHPAVKPEAFGDRKELAVYCQRQVARGIEECLTGREITGTELPRLPALA